MTEANSRFAQLEALLEKRIVVLDGAMGTMVQAHGLSEADYRGERFADWGSELKGNHDLLTLTKPDVVREIHRQFLESGADVIETNTFNATAPSLSDYGLQDYVAEINREAARLARGVVDEFSAETDTPRFVAGALGPLHPDGGARPGLALPSRATCQGIAIPGRETAARASTDVP